MLVVTFSKCVCRCGRAQTEELLNRRLGGYEGVRGWALTGGWKVVRLGQAKTCLHGGSSHLMDKTLYLWNILINMYLYALITCGDYEDNI